MTQPSRPATQLLTLPEGVRPPLHALPPPPDSFRERDERFTGDSHTVSLGALQEDDRGHLRRLYDGLLRLHEAFLQTDDGLPDLEAVLTDESLDVAALGQAARQLGSNLEHDELPADTRQAYHDLRGGALSALLMHLDLAAAGLGRPKDTERVGLLVRDQLKMMRNAVHDLDRPRYEADLKVNGHSIELLREKWDQVPYVARGRQVQVHYLSSFDGDIAERCMEFSALDRALYNLINNAAEHAATDHVVLSVRPHGHHQVQLAVSNRVTDAQAEAIREAFGSSPGQLFAGGFTTDGHGLGMRIVAELVVHSYALDSVDQAIRERYVGVEIVDGWFNVYCHWPAL